MCLEVQSTFVLVVTSCAINCVTTAEKLRLSNSAAGKYLLTKTSVDGIEWICQSCYKHLKKDKIPPCATKNGMSFPAKPDFFDLNELECRLLAPRLAFQKLLQAPRGNPLMSRIERSYKFCKFHDFSF